MPSIHLLKSQPATGFKNPDRLFAIMKNWESPEFSIIDLVNAMGFKSPAPLRCCLDVLQNQGHITIVN